MPDTLFGKKILIVEDNPLLAHHIGDLVEDHAGTPIGPALCLASACDLAQRIEPSAALLDISLGAEKVWPLARMLKHRGTPFAFISAECTEDDLPEEFADTTCVEKPAATDQIMTTLTMLVASTSRAGKV